MNQPIRAAALAAALAAAFLALPACAGLSEEEESKLNEYKLNSKNYYNQEKYLQAIDQCGKGLAIDGSDYSLNLELGMAYFYHSHRLRDHGEKMRYLFAALEQLEKTDSLGGGLFSRNDDFRVHLGLGMVHYKIAIEYHRQMKELERLVEEGQDEEADTLDRIEACREGFEDEIEFAKSYLEDVLSFDRQSENMEAILYLGQVHAYKRDFDEAIAYLEQGLVLLERSNRFIKRRLESEDTMDTDEREFNETRLATNLMREKELRGILANIYGRLGRNEERLAQFEILEERELLEGVAFYNKALAEQALGRYPQAIMDFNRFIRIGLAPDSTVEDRERLHTAINKMMEMVEKMDRTGAVEQYLSDFPDREKNLRCALAAMYASVGMHEECVKEYDKLQTRGLMDGDLYFNRALAEQELGRYHEAILDYERFLHEGGLMGLQVGNDERFRIATENIQECQARLEEEG